MSRARPAIIRSRSTTDGPFTVEDRDKTLPLDAKKRGGVEPAHLGDRRRRRHCFGHRHGPGRLRARARNTRSTVKPATQILARRTVKPLNPGQSITRHRATCSADLVPGTGKVALSVTPSAALDVASLLAALDRYPLGCTEQIVSRALPLLYVNELALDAQLAVDTGVDERIAKAIEIVLARQGSEGAFGLWSPGGEDAWLDAYVTDFLTRARARGFSVSGRPVQARARPLAQLCEHGARRRHRRRARARLCALRAGAQRHGAGRRSSLHRRRQARRSRRRRRPRPRSPRRSPCSATGSGPRRPSTPRSPRLPKEPAFEGGRIDYGSPLRDAAAVVTLAAEGDAPKLILVSATKRIDTARNLVTTPRRRRTPGSCSRRARSASRMSASTSTMAAQAGPALSQLTTRIELDGTAAHGDQ